MLKKLKKLFDREAKKNNVYPLDDRFVERGTNPERPSLTRGKTRFEYKPGAQRIPEGSAPPTYARNHSITVNFDSLGKSGNGVLLANGRSSAGYALYVIEGKPVYEMNFFGKERFVVKSDDTLPEGKVSLMMKYTQQGKAPLGGTAKLFVNGEEVASGKIDKVPPVRYSATETLDIGMDLGSAVSTAYRNMTPFVFNSTLEKVLFDLE